MADVTKALQEAMSGWFGVLMTRSQVTAILVKVPKLRVEAEEMGVDTSVREWMVDEVARSVELQRWPRGGDTTAYCVAFVEEFKARAAANNIKVEDDFGSWAK